MVDLKEIYQTVNKNTTETGAWVKVQNFQNPEL